MVKIFHVDAFTAEPFKGNPAAVCILDSKRDDEWMQGVAAEMNLSETAFLTSDGGGFNLRWFTPAVEVDLCGHATLASAHILWEEGVVSEGDEVAFFTRSGTLRAVRRDGGWIEMDFPTDAATLCADPGGLVSVLGVTSRSISKNRFDYLVEVATEDEVRAVAPDMRELAEVETRGVIVTAKSSSPDFDFVSRFFAPRVGIDEDPVTGSAHSALGPYWAKVLEKQELIGFQASSRGGVVKVAVRGERVLLSGQAVTVTKGELTL